ncbi:MAG: hypothetical protein Q9M33_08520 [Robiginitomaculum sp.]|nr:hypothetical protein [Robiginitomaculum sp.]MDQ7077155.1 hypothetical protein [Robiginitomaculum sp.]
MDFEPLDFDNETRREAIARKARVAGGVALIAVGLPLIPFPIPIGGIVTASGVVVLVRNSRRARRTMGSFLARYPKTGKHIRGFFAKRRKKN